MKGLPTIKISGQCQRRSKQSKYGQNFCLVGESTGREPEEWRREGAQVMCIREVFFVCLILIDRFGDRLQY